MNDTSNILKKSELAQENPYFDGYRPSYYFNIKRQSHIDSREDSFSSVASLKQIQEEMFRSVNINYGDNTMSFDKNGDIKINDRLLENDKEIVDALRKLLKLK